MIGSARSATRVLAAAIFGLIHAGHAWAAGPSTADVARDPAAAWEAFLRTAESDAVYKSYNVLDQVSYDLSSVDAAQCGANARALAAAVEAAPVSIALRHAAMLCAESVKDEAGAEAQFAALGALAKLALSQASDVAASRPIRVVRLEDVLALIKTSGMEGRYFYYLLPRPARYFPLVAAVSQPGADTERHLRFDFVDVGAELIRKDPNARFPMQRDLLMDAFIEGQTKSNYLAAWDVRALQQASEADSPAARIEKLRPAAEMGGMRSALAWAVLCVRDKAPDCGVGLVDALLPQAENKNALAMTLLAFAYAEGLGVKPDPKTAVKLLDAADARWPQAQASLEYVDLWAAVRGHDLPPELRARVERAAALGNPNAKTMLIAQKIDADKTTALTPEEMAFLSRPDQNGTGRGYGLLAKYYESREQAKPRLEWLAKAAAAGDADSQAQYGWLLWEGEDLPKDKAAGLRWHEQAAQGGDVWGARFMSMESAGDGDGAAAEKWLYPAIWAGSTTAAVDLAELFQRGLKGVSGDAARAVKIFTALADDDVGARRELARMTLAGQGTAKDPQRAKRLLVQNAEAGDAESQAILGIGMLDGSFGNAEEKAGMRWVESAMQAKNRYVFVGYGTWLYYTKNTAQSRLQAIEVWERGVQADSSLSKNNLAWARCTSPDPAVLDPAKGLQVAAAMGDVDDMAAAELDTVAACHAANRDFGKAIDVQSKAIVLVEKIAPADPAAPVDPVDDDDGYKSRLALYRAGKPYVETTRE